ncbi:hypothetical protein [Pseudoalteromonas sp. R3]|nr:hypothetical protein [Pseudoalteromonas sp. R3]
MQLNITKAAQRWCETQSRVSVEALALLLIAYHSHEAMKGHILEISQAI